MNRKYSKELKLEVVKKRLAGASPSQLAKEYELTDTSRVYRWVKQYKSGNTNFEDARGKATKKDSPNKGRQKIIKRSDMTDAEYIRYLEMENDVLKKTLEVEASIGSNKYIKLEVVKALSSKYPITALCNYLGASTSTYYLYLKRNPQKYDFELVKIVKEIHSKRISSGYRTITSAIKRRYNITVNHKKIYRIMKFLQIKGKQYRRKYKFNHALKKSKIFDNVLKRDFNCRKSNEKWSIDITYIPDRERNTYLVCIKDLYDKRIVNFKNSNNMSEEFVLECVREAFEKNNIQGKKLILHSDQGIHFSTYSYIKLLNSFGVIGSHSRKANCHDNAPIESFFSIFKREAFNFEKPDNFLHTIRLTNEFINYYNYEREQYGLKRKTPSEFHLA